MIGGRGQRKDCMIILKARSIIEKYSLLNNGERVLIGVSGGPDSMVLLNILNTLKNEFKLKLFVAHLDHMLRKDSFKDAEFVKNAAERLKIPYIGAKIKIRKLAKGSLEEIARNARLNFLFKTAKIIKADKIALGHNLNDQAETVIMRILRGAGLYGLAGILPKRKINGFTVIRPLISVSRKEIESYLNKNKIRAVIDETNLKDIYFRNKIRNRLIPLLEKEYNLNIKEVLANMAETIAFDYDYLSSAAKRIDEKFGRKIKLKRFLTLHPAIRRLILRQRIEKITGNTRKIGFKHIKEIEDLIQHRPVNSVVDLPKEASVAKKGASLFFYKRS